MSSLVLSSPVDPTDTTLARYATQAERDADFLAYMAPRAWGDPTDPAHYQLNGAGNGYVSLADRAGNGISFVQPVAGSVPAFAPNAFGTSPRGNTRDAMFSDGATPRYMTSLGGLFTGDKPITVAMVIKSTDVPIGGESGIFGTQAAGRFFAFKEYDFEYLTAPGPGNYLGPGMPITGIMGLLIAAINYTGTVPYPFYFEFAKEVLTGTISDVAYATGTGDAILFSSTTLFRGYMGDVWAWDNLYLPGDATRMTYLKQYVADKYRLPG